MEFLEARTIDVATLYERRKQVIQLYESGMSYLEIVPPAGIHCNTAGQWVTA